MRIDLDMRKLPHPSLDLNQVWFPGKEDDLSSAGRAARAPGVQLAEILARGLLRAAKVGPARCAAHNRQSRPATFGNVLVRKMTEPGKDPLF